MADPQRIVRDLAIVMTPQQTANEFLAIWQAQRVAGIPPEERGLPSPANDRDSFERDLEIIRQAMERH